MALKSEKSRGNGHLDRGYDDGKIDGWMWRLTDGGEARRTGDERGERSKRGVLVERYYGFKQGDSHRFQEQLRPSEWL
jgi:hypothetical protein